MRTEPAGDFDYEHGGAHYSSVRRAEPAFARSIRGALGDAVSLINVGAGAGSYEPDDMVVTAIEPSAAIASVLPCASVAEPCPGLTTSVAANVWPAAFGVPGAGGATAPCEAGAGAGAGDGIGD